MLLKLGVLGAMALMAVVPAFAQDRVEATIPFALNVGSTTLPAGHYEIQKVYADTLEIQNRATQQAAMALTNADSPKKIVGDAVVSSTSTATPASSLRSRQATPGGP